MTWWDRYDDVLQEEVALLAAAGMQPEISEEARLKGVLNIAIRLKVFVEDRDGVIQYPDLYPYFRPVLFVPGLGFDLRHYDPLSDWFVFLGGERDIGRQP